VASLNLPLHDAIALAERKVVTVGWTRCRAKLLEKSQPTCYRCQGKGHLNAECLNEAKPRGCFKCKKADHLAKDCVQLTKAHNQPQQQTTPSSQGEDELPEATPNTAP